MTSSVYFIRCQDKVKIGWSDTPSKRIAALRAAIPFDIEVLGIIPGSKQDERDLHLRFAAQRDRGEWFIYSDEIGEAAQGGILPFRQRTTTPHHLVDEAVRLFGSEKALAQAIGYSQQHVNRLRLGEGRVKAEIAIAIDRATAGRVPKHRLRPDLFDAPPEIEAAA